MVKPIPPHFFTVALPGLFSVGVYLVIRFYFSIKKADQSNFLSIWGAFGLSLEWGNNLDCGKFEECEIIWDFFVTCGL